MTLGVKSSLKSGSLVHGMNESSIRATETYFLAHGLALLSSWFRPVSISKDEYMVDRINLYDAVGD